MLRPPAPACMASRRRAAACTVAPPSAKRLAVASPIPLLAPMTNAVFPERSVPSTTPPALRGRLLSVPRDLAPTRRTPQAPPPAARRVATPRYRPFPRRAIRAPARSPRPCTHTSPAGRVDPAHRLGIRPSCVLVQPYPHDPP